MAKYLDQIIPPVLACFQDQDARVRYYACESMYNIAKVAKGEILPFFNQVFDSLSKVRREYRVLQVEATQYLTVGLCSWPPTPNFQ